MGRVRAAAIGAMLIVLGASLVQVVRADRLCARLAPKPPAEAKAGKVHEFTYAADEAYMHLALARQMALASASAQDPFPAASALAHSASPAWTSLLAGFIRLGGGTEEKAARHAWIERLWPLVLNLALGGLLVMLIGHSLRLDVHSSWGMLGRLVAVAMLMPIPLLALSGMEHLAHAFVVLLAVSSGIELIERERLAARRLLSSGVWMALAVSLRFESLAVLAGLVLWAWIRRHVGRSVLLAMAGLGVPVGLSAYLGSHGQSWLPEPVRTRLLNGGINWASWSTVAMDRAIGNLAHALVPAALVMVAAAMLWSRREQQSSPDAEDRIRVGWLFVFLVAGVIQLLLGTSGEQFRYAAYLVPLGAVAILRALANRPGAKWAPEAPVGLRYSVMAVFCLLPLAVAAVPVFRAVWNAPQACAEVYLRDRLMATFVRSYFRPEADSAREPVVASNEVGALRYETSARVVDLASIRREPDFGEAAQDVQLAFWAGPPSADFPNGGSWLRAGGWRPAGGGDWRVDVYAAGRTEAEKARLALRDFKEKMVPAEVDVDVAGGPASRPAMTAAGLSCLNARVLSRM
jgi:hypothetical protein